MTEISHPLVSESSREKHSPFPVRPVRPVLVLPCFIAGVMLFGTSVLGRTHGDGDRKPVVPVPPFENVSKVHQNINYEVANGTDPDRTKRRFLVDRLTEAPRSILEIRPPRPSPGK